MLRAGSPIVPLLAFVDIQRFGARGAGVYQQAGSIERVWLGEGGVGWRRRRVSSIRWGSCPCSSPGEVD